MSHALIIEQNLVAGNPRAARLCEPVFKIFYHVGTE